MNDPPSNHMSVCRGDAIYILAFLLLVYQNFMQWLSRESVYLVLLLVTGFHICQFFVIKSDEHPTLSRF